jgi:oxygen-independent coproporphyrinogen-3 oxidase
MEAMTGSGGFKRSARLGSDEPWEGSYFVSTYPPFSWWDAASISDVEHALESRSLPARDQPFGLYVHVPFCVQRCHYCYYLSSVGWASDTVDGYLDAVVQELSLYRVRPRLEGRRPAFVYFGGGTPSILSPPQIRAFLRRLQAIFPWENVEEVTFECAPASVTTSKLRALRESGVTRLSVGVQQLSDHVLAANGRVHRERDVEQAFAVARQVGFDVVNLDLMVGLVGETDETFDRSLERVSVPG